MSKNRKKNKNAFVAVLLLTVASIIGVITPMAAAAGNVCTWTGSGSDSNFSTVANWSGCGGTAPTNTDSLVFTNTALTADAIATNDISNLSVGTVTFDGTNTQYRFTITGNNLTITSGIVANKPALFSATIILGGDLSLTGSSYAQLGAVALGGHTLTSGVYTTLSGAVSGTGNIQTNDSLIFGNTSDNSWSGNLGIASGASASIKSGSLGGTATAVTVVSGGSLYFCGLNGGAVSQSITVGGSGIGGFGALGAYTVCGGGGSSEADPLASVILSGQVILTSDTTTNSFGDMTITGPLSGSYGISMRSGSPGRLIINSSNNTSGTPNGASVATVEVIKYESNEPSTPIMVSTNQEAIVTGVYGDVTITGGRLKGTGTVGAINMTGGAIAPGMSPGTLSTGALFFSGGTLEEEIGGTAVSAYDRLVVTGSVSLGNATTLAVTRYNGFKPSAGQKYVIIDNDGADAVTGAFASLAEGATFRVDNYVFKISYKGGDGNDVEVTVISVPSVPETGLALAMANPMITSVIMIGTASAIYVIYQRGKLIKHCTRR